MRREETFEKRETKIAVGGKIYTPILEDYQNGKLKDCKKVTLNDTLKNFGFFTSKTFIRCCDCGSIVTAGSKRKERCAECNAEHYNKYHRGFYKNNKSFYLYIIEDKDNVIRYSGITSSMVNRVSAHMNCRVSATRELFKNNNWKFYKFVDLADVVNSENELKILENVMMGDLNTYKNSDSIKDIDKKRREELLEEFKYHDFKVYKENIN
ncbi:GIY-YIG nuclease family protein [Clostridium perfringens]|nr:GIY-YIG nuclease family protein [Clostridium perfringens]MDM0744433.1 GIY-YIG nuclease family protein [Clostridium perfringens]MDM0870007.1 GIY-YIG nuclease family protein [Clostridium perfringens]MDM0872935.1 GIY-YIG nuclease family protein [Clostridium perfringens]MDM1023355.1 GIY-YIG nuclease family protein [Clostridium perfringens]